MLSKNELNNFLDKYNSYLEAEDFDGLFQKAGTDESFLFYDAVETLDAASVDYIHEINQIYPSMYFGRDDLETFTIPDNIKNISIDSFSYCKNLTKVNILGTISNIGDGAFAGDEKLKEINLPKGLKLIDDSAFAKCIVLEKIDLPDSLTFIGDGAFDYCYALKSVVIPDSVTKINSSVFNACTSLTDVVLPAGIKEILYYSFSTCRSLESITYKGTKAEWKAISKVKSWNYGSAIKVIHCSDGDVEIKKV